MSDADDPFQFLALCFEWAEFKKHGWGYVSHLPVQMDGSSNGLQNFSAMLLDPIGGEAVNLVPSDKPQDIYQRVADKVEERVVKDAQGDNEEIAKLAQGWLKYGIDRDVCKRPVMTLAYGAKAFGFKQQVYDDTVHPYKLKCSQIKEGEEKEKKEEFPLGRLQVGRCQLHGQHHLGLCR